MLRYLYFLLYFQCAASVDSVDDIIDHYKKEQIVEGYNLKEPVSVQVTAGLPVCYVFNTTGHHLTCFFLTYCSTRSKFLLTQWMAEKFITLSGGKQKMLSTRTLWRKATSCSTKVWEVPASLRCHKWCCFCAVAVCLTVSCPSGKGKRWKNLYFILEGNDAQLIYFESEKRATKPKGLIDLSVCSVYGVHDSLFGRWDMTSWLLFLTRKTFLE